MSQRPLTVAVVQMTSTDDVDANLMQIERLIEDIPADAGVQLAVFPENALYLRLKEGERIRGLELADGTFETLRGLALRRKMHLHLTTPVSLDGHVYNASVWITDEGDIRPVYQKMHLFDIALSSGPAVRESDAFRHGSGPSVIEIHGWKIGESICYDLRFAELYSIYARREVDLILIPSAFLVRTGEAHWDVLVRARAIESQCYVLAPAQAGTHQGSRGGGVRETFGRSLAVDPWGRILGVNEAKGPGVSIVTLHPSVIAEVRKQIPMRDHRRLPGAF